MTLRTEELNDVAGHPIQESPANVDEDDDDGGAPIVYRVLDLATLGSFAVVRPRRAATDGDR